jgi:hypothetical protein
MKGKKMMSKIPQVHLDLLRPKTRAVTTCP